MHADGRRRPQSRARNGKSASPLSLFIRTSGKPIRPSSPARTQYGTFVRTLDPHVDGMVVRGAKGLDVGDRVTVKLVNTDPQRGYIDFEA